MFQEPIYNKFVTVNASHRKGEIAVIQRTGQNLMNVHSLKDLVSKHRNFVETALLWKILVRNARPLISNFLIRTEIPYEDVNGRQKCVL